MQKVTETVKRNVDVCLSGGLALMKLVYLKSGFLKVHNRVGYFDADGLYSHLHVERTNKPL